MNVDRQTVDLSAYPELIVIYLGMRQYWRDFEALERWARSEPHRLWWKQFLRFASVQPAKGGMFTARDRLKLAGTAEQSPVFTEEELYSGRSDKA